ncbi:MULTISPECIES: thioredoxin family protein [Pseudomonas]|uniref:Thioredoxin family protein n=1 Tax=Pseudomonas brassicacearum TaxID=930166 RepID=A0AAJ3KWJ7_9PSED|nr:MULTISPECIES: thioredoxin family protein [Pseudomonas]NUT82336.1 thioredoxin family protein [Pseudomonas brassicacearum]QGA49422.1 thioredoxin family protein [Pseudomonas brassicacearum]
MSETNKIDWVHHTSYVHAIEQSKSTGKPILIYFHSQSCNGCNRLVDSVFNDPQLIGAVNESTIPVWVEVENSQPDPRISELVGSHIFIMSPVLQLISSDGDIYHKFLGAPLHTRLDLGYCRVHHDVEGDIDASETVSQLSVGLAKQAMASFNYSIAESKLRKALNASSTASVAVREAAYWLPVVQARGQYPEDSLSEDGIAQTAIAREVRRFCNTLIQVPDHELMADWPGVQGEGGWAHYTDCLRELCLGIYQMLLDVATETAQKRAAQGRGLSRAQMIIRDWQISFRDLQASLIGLKGPEYDQQHLHQNYTLGKQRTIRNNIVHCVMAEFWAHSPAIRSTLEASRTGIRHSKDVSPALLNWKIHGPAPYNFGSIQSLLTLWEKRHQQLVEEFSGITDTELDASLNWWEDSPISVKFRLCRLGWHFHDHAAVVETICQRIGHERSETELLAKLLFNALGRAEGEMVGLSRDEQQALFASAASQLKTRSDELARVYEGYLYKRENASYATSNTQPVAAAV